MPKPEKVKIVEEIKGKLTSNPNFVITEYSGMNVEEMNNMRNLLREKDISYSIYKNTLFKIALESLDIKGLEKYFSGPVGVAFNKEEIVSACKILSEVSKKTSKLKLKGGYTEGLLVKEDEIIEYVNMPSKEELYSKLLATIINPATRLVKVLNRPTQTLVYVLKEIAEKKQQ